MLTAAEPEIHKLVELTEMFLQFSSKNFIYPRGGSFAERADASTVHIRSSAIQYTTASNQSASD